MKHEVHSIYGRVSFVNWVLVLPIATCLFTDTIDIFFITTKKPQEVTFSTCL